MWKLCTDPPGGDVPAFGGAELGRDVDAGHVHVLAVDVGPVEPEPAGGGDLVVGQVGGGGQLGRDLRRRVEPVGGAQFEDVERVVGAGEPVVGRLQRGAAQGDPFTGLHRDHDLGAFARRELQVGHRRRPRQQPAVGGDDVVGPVVGEAEVVDPGVGGVQDPQPDQLGAHLQVGPRGAVDQDRVAQDAGALEEPRAGVQVAAVELLVLHDQRDVVHAVLRRQSRAAGAVGPAESSGRRG